jgi:NADH:ubiquinone oxidoreductase subunit 2 (subunit N)
MAIFLLSLAGIPPLAASPESKFTLRGRRRASSISSRPSASLQHAGPLYYYLRIVRTMFLDQPRGDGAVAALARTTRFSSIPSRSQRSCSVYWAR